MKNQSQKTETGQGKKIASMEMASSLNLSLEEARNELKELNAESRLRWSFEKFKTSFALTTSFGVQSAVLLHMLNKLHKGSEIPVIWIDTGYLP